MLQTYEDNVLLDTSNIWNLIYPKGSLFWSTINISPEQLYKNYNIKWEWKRVSGVVYAIDPENIEDQELAANTNTGIASGSNKMTLSINNMPKHSHTIDGKLSVALKRDENGSDLTIALEPGSSLDLDNIFTSNLTDLTGQSEPFSIVPRRTLAYCWRRIS